MTETTKNMISLSRRQKKAIQNGHGKRLTCRQLEKKDLAEITDEFLDPETKARMAEIELTGDGETLKRKIEDPTVDHF
jgi:hypothetical protein